MNIEGAYTSKIRPPIANSDHNVVYLVPTYKPKLKRNKPERKTIRVWSPDSIEGLKACFDCTMWEEFQQDSLDETVTVTTDYIGFCVQSVIPSKEIKIYPNNKMYVTRDVKHLMNLRKIAFRNKDIRELKRLEKELKGKLHDAKRAHKLQLEKAFKSKNSKQLWDKMKSMTGMSNTRKALVTDNEEVFANQLNSFFARFENVCTCVGGCVCTNGASDVINSVSLLHAEKINITEEEVRSTFHHLNGRKATGPDNLSAFVLKTCAAELAPVWQPVFQCSMDTHIIPTKWKTSHIIPLPKIKCPKEPGDYRPVALTPVIMKVLEKIVVGQLTKSVGGELDLYQFAYKQNRSTEDAVVALTHLILQHLDKPKNTARALFLDFTSAFNTIQPELLLTKMVQLQVNPYLIHWYYSFLTDRVQLVRVNQTTSTPITTNIGSPQGSVSSPFLFTIYTDDCRAVGPNTFIIKFSDDTTLLSLLDSKDNPSIHQERTDSVVQWCEENALIINAGKTKEIIFGVKESEYPPPVTIQKAQIEQGSAYKYLGIQMDTALSWSAHIDFICKKVQQRIYFLRRLRSFGANKTILLLFFQSIVQSVMLYGCCAWYSCLSVQLKARLGRLVRICSKIVGRTLETGFQEAHRRRILFLARRITSDPTHVLFKEFELLPSNRRFRVPQARLNRLRNSFVSQAVKMLNQARGSR